MAISLKHAFASAKADGADSTLVQPSNWNAEHTLTLAAGKVLGRDTSGSGAAQELPIAVDSSGRLGIGGSPSGLLDVYNSLAQHTVASFYQANASYNTDLAINHTSATGSFLISRRSSGQAWLYTSTTDPIAFYVNATQRAYVDTAGFNVVGNIGLTNTASYTPQVVLNNTVADATGPFVILVKGRASNTTSQSGDQLGTVLFQGRDTSNVVRAAASIAALQDGASGASSVNGMLLLCAGANAEVSRVTSDGLYVGSTGGDYGITWRSVFRKDSSGATSVGIINANTASGTTARLGKITGTGNSYVNWDLVDNAGSPFDKYEYGSGVSTVYWNFGGTSRMSIDYLGSFTTTGSNGSVQHSNTGDQIVFTRNGYNYLTASGASAALQIQASGASGVLTFATGSTERMRIDSSGQIGIGTASPDVPLVVQANASALGINLRGRSSDNISLVQFKNNANSSTLGKFGHYGTDMLLANIAAGALAFYTSDTERMRINSSGKVGIGTASPLNELHISGSMTLQQNYSTYLVNSYYDGAWKYVENGLAWGIGSNFGGPTGGICIAAAASNSSGAGAALTWLPRLNIDSAGNVGIGTTSPAAKLDVNNGTAQHGVARFYQDNASYNCDVALQHVSAAGNFLISRRSNGEAWLYTSSTDPIVFYTNGSEKMRITPDGNVGIGTTSPSSTLDVAGTIAKNGVTITPWINVKTDHGAKGNADDASPTDDTSAINLAIAAANAATNGAVIYFPPGAYKVTAALTTITKNGVRVVGSGRQLSIIKTTHATADTLTFNCQYSSLENISFEPSVARTGGYEVVVTGGFQNVIQDISIAYGYNGISIVSTPETMLKNINLRYLRGTIGVGFSGTSSVPIYGGNVTNLVGDNPTVTNVTHPTNIKGNLANSTAYSLNDLVISNSWVWQCTTAGTSAASASLTVPTASGLAFTNTDVTTGTAKFRALYQTGLTWVSVQNYANTIRLTSLALLNGGYGVKITDAANTGSSYVSWVYGYSVECDHNYYSGIEATGGLGLHLHGCWVGSSYTGNGINIGSSFKGEVSITDCRVLASGQHGILVDGGVNTQIMNSQVCNNGLTTSNTYHGITIGAGVSEFIIVGNFCGRLVPNTTAQQGYGVYVATGASDRYIISNNVCRANVSGGVTDGGSGSNKSVTANVT